MSQQINSKHLQRFPVPQQLCYHKKDCWIDSCIHISWDAPLAIFYSYILSAPCTIRKKRPPDAQYSQCGEPSCWTKGLVRSSHMSAPRGRWRTSETRWAMTQQTLAAASDLGPASGVKKNQSQGHDGGDEIKRTGSSEHQTPCPTRGVWESKV